MTGDILVLRAGALGDTILTLPALHALRSRYPSSRLRVAGYPAVWAVAEPLADEIISIDSPMFAGLYTASPSSKLRSWLHNVDLAIAWTVHDPRPALERAGVPQIVHASPYPPPGIHAAGWLIQSLPFQSSHAIKQEIPLLDLTEEERMKARAALAMMGVERPVIIHPGAGARWKRWPPERFAALANELSSRGHEVLLAEGPADAEAVDDVQQHLADPLPVLHNLPIRHLAAILAQAALFIGNDSGVTHLAGAAGAPTIALFGPTDPISWAPLGRTSIVRACSMRTARQGQIRVCKDPECMAAISVEKVLAAVSTAVRNRYPRPAH